MDVAVAVVGLTVVTGGTTTGGVTTPTLPELLMVAPTDAGDDVLAACKPGTPRQSVPPNTPTVQIKPTNLNGKLYNSPPFVTISTIHETHTRANKKRID